MSLTPNLTLTLMQQPMQSGAPGENIVIFDAPTDYYTYHHAISDAVGGQGYGNAWYIEPSRENNTLFL
jgi:hypothetical protein